MIPKELLAAFLLNLSQRCVARAFDPWIQTLMLLLERYLDSRSRNDLKTPTTVGALEELGRIQLSKSFFMRDFLYSEISQIESIPNIPDDPALAIEVGKRLCEEVLEPIQAQLGRISIRSAFRCAAVNARGAANKNQYNCASTESNYARHTSGTVRTRTGTREPWRASS